MFSRRLEIPAVFAFFAFFAFAVFVQQPEFPGAVTFLGLPSHHVFIGGLSLMAFALALAASPSPMPFDYWMAGLAAAFGLSVIFAAGNTANAAKVFAGFVFKGFLPAATAARLPRFAVRSKISGALVITAAAAAALSLPMLLGYWEVASIPINYSPTGNPLPTAAFALMFLPLAVNEAIKRRRILGYLPVALIGSAVFFSFSRSGWTAAVAGGGLFVLLSPDLPSAAKKRTFAAALAALAAALILILALFPHKLPSGKFTPSSIAASGSLTHRIGAYSSAAKMFAARPLFGVGFGNYPLYHRDYLSEGMDLITNTPDNMYLRMLCDTGITGTLAFFAFTLYWMRKFFKNRRDNIVLAVFCGLTGFLVNQLSADLMFWQAPQVAYWTLLGMGAGISGTRDTNG